MEGLDTATKAYMVKMLRDDWNLFTEKQLKHICRLVDYAKVPDRYLSDNDYLHDFIEWDRIDKMQILRLTIRNLKLLDKHKVDFKKFDYKVKEIIYLLKSEPNYIESFNIDLNKISAKDASIILSLGKEYFLDKIKIENYRFSYKEVFEIATAYDYNSYVMHRLDLSLLKGYQIAKVIIATGKEFLISFDLDKLSTIDWLDLLKYRPEFIDKCNIDLFMMSDIFYLIELVTMFDEPDLSNLLFTRELREITPLGWEKLLIDNPDKYVEVCDFSKLNELNWFYIRMVRPELVVYKL